MPLENGKLKPHRHQQRLSPPQAGGHGPARVCILSFWPSVLTSWSPPGTSSWPWRPGSMSSPRPLQPAPCLSKPSQAQLSGARTYLGTCCPLLMLLTNGLLFKPSTHPPALHSLWKLGLILGHLFLYEHPWSSAVRGDPSSTSWLPCTEPCSLGKLAPVCETAEPATPFRLCPSHRLSQLDSCSSHGLPSSWGPTLPITRFPDWIFTPRGRGTVGRQFIWAPLLAGKIPAQDSKS